jgi:hypothetical protein
MTKKLLRAGMLCECVRQRLSFYGSVWLPNTNCANLPLPYGEERAVGIKDINHSDTPG